MPRRIGEELEVIWNTYYRVNDPIFTLGTVEFQHQAETLFWEAHLIGADIRENDKLRLSLKHPSGLGDARLPEVQEAWKKAHKDLEGLRSRADGLRAEVEALPDDQP